MLEAFRGWDWKPWRIDQRQAHPPSRGRPPWWPAPGGTRATDTQRAEARKKLVDALEQGLARSEGQHLEHHNVYAHLVARLGPSALKRDGLRPCEHCALVFKAPRARRCPGCRDARVTLRPHHVAVHLGPSWRDPSGQGWGEARYDIRCTECGRIVPRHARPQDDHCLNCRGNAARQRRHNGRPGPGRKQWRFRHKNGSATRLSCARPSGSTLALEAADGVFVVTDAEDAELLKGNLDLVLVET